jgi:hypothetical protein
MTAHACGPASHMFGSTCDQQASVSVSQVGPARAHMDTHTFSMTWTGGCRDVALPASWSATNTLVGVGCSAAPCLSRQRMGVRLQHCSLGFSQLPPLGLQHPLIQLRTSLVVLNTHNVTSTVHVSITEVLPFRTALMASVGVPGTGTQRQQDALPGGTCRWPAVPAPSRTAAGASQAPSPRTRHRDPVAGCALHR